MSALGIGRRRRRGGERNAHPTPRQRRNVAGKIQPSAGSARRDNNFFNRRRRRLRRARGARGGSGEAGPRSRVYLQGAGAGTVLDLVGNSFMTHRNKNSENRGYHGSQN